MLLREHVKSNNFLLCYNESMPDDNSNLVYSTDQAVPVRKRGVKAGKSINATAENNNSSTPVSLTVRLERKGRGGKSVSVIDGLQMPGKKKEGLLRQLKTNLGTGGTLTDSNLEIQGDHCSQIIEVLGRLGYNAKRSGG